MKIAKFHLSKKAKLIGLPVLAVAAAVPAIVLISTNGNDKQDNVNLSSTTQNADKEAAVKAVDSVDEAQEQQAAPVQQAAQEPVQEEQLQPVNPFQQGGASWYAYNRRVEVGKFVVLAADEPHQNNYCYVLRNRGNEATSTPSLHALACRQTHVAVVEKINDDGSIWLSEMNSRGQVSMEDATPAGGFNRVNYKLIPADQLSSYSYIQ